MTQQAQTFISRPTKLGGSIADCVVCGAPLTSYEVRGGGMDRLGHIIDRSACYCCGCVHKAPKSTEKLLDDCADQLEQMTERSQELPLEPWAENGLLASCGFLHAERMRVIAAELEAADIF